MKPIKIWLIGLCLMLGFSTCKKKCCDPNDPNCENYDPYFGKNLSEANSIFNGFLSEFFFLLITNMFNDNFELSRLILDNLF